MHVIGAVSTLVLIVVLDALGVAALIRTLTDLERGRLNNRLASTSGAALKALKEPLSMIGSLRETSSGIAPQHAVVAVRHEEQFETSPEH